MATDKVTTYPYGAKTSSARYRVPMGRLDDEKTCSELNRGY